jgi:GNAT superfamily N-acetyltransferase
MTIRPYADPDAGAVVRLALRAWAPVFESLAQAMDPAVYRTFYPDWQVQQQRSVEAVLADPDQHVWVAERDGEPVGFVAVVLHRDGNMGEIHMIAVEPDHQGTGVGAALTEFAVDWMRKAGMAVAMVETGGDPGHAPARRTYERAGFRVLPVARFFKKL